MSSNKRFPCRRPTYPSISSILTKPVGIGAYRQSLSHQKALRVAKHCQNLGGESETRIFRASQGSRVVSLCTRLALLAGIGPRMVRWRWLKRHWRCEIHVYSFLYLYSHVFGSRPKSFSAGCPLYNCRVRTFVDRVQVFHPIYDMASKRLTVLLTVIEFPDNSGSRWANESVE